MPVVFQYQGIAQTPGAEAGDTATAIFTSPPVPEILRSSRIAGALIYQPPFEPNASPVPPPAPDFFQSQSARIAIPPQRFGPSTFFSARFDLPTTSANNIFFSQAPRIAQRRFLDAQPAITPAFPTLPPPPAAPDLNSGQVIQPFRPVNRQTFGHGVFATPPASSLTLTPVIPDSPYLGQKVPLVPRDPNIDKRTREHTDVVSTGLNSLLRRGELVNIGGGKWRIGLAPHSADRDPNASDDSTAGHFIGQNWVNTLTQKAFICISNTAGAAIWAGPLG